MSIKSLDVRGMDAPGPAEAIIKNLQGLSPGDVLEVIGDKPFKSMIPLLEDRGYACSLQEKDGGFILKIEVKEGSEPPVMDDVGCEGLIDENTNVGKIIKNKPEAIDVLVDAGFTPLKNPAVRHMASTVSLKTAAKIIGMDEKGLKELIRRLNAL